MEKQEKLLTGNDVAQRLQISKVHAYRLMRRGEIPVIRFGKVVRVRPQDLEKFIEKHTTSLLK